MPANIDFATRLVDGKGLWKDHLSNRPYAGSLDSSQNRTDINQPDAFVLPMDRSQAFSLSYISILTNFLSHSYEAFLLSGDEKKVEEKIDTRMPNTSYFHFNKEDHTLANLLRAKLLSSNHILFAAYRVSLLQFTSYTDLTFSRCHIHCSQLSSSECKQMARSLPRKQSLPAAEI